MMKAKSGPVRKRSSYSFVFGPNNNAFTGSLTDLALEERLADYEEIVYIDYCESWRKSCQVDMVEKTNL